MGRSRYAGTSIIDDHHFATWRLPVKSIGLKEVDLLEGVRTFEYTIKRGDRVDVLANKFFNDEEYWWVICLINKIDYPFASGGFVPGLALKIPFDVKDVLDKLPSSR